MRVGLVGLPNVGKSTLFNALTSSAQAEAANYPFCTIDPNVGVVELEDERLLQIAKIIQPKKTIPTTVSFVDIAGLVKGASQGKGVGNQFLSHIRSTQALCHVVRCFDDDDVVHVEGRVDPVQDIESIHTELLLSDLEQVQKKQAKWQKLAKASKQAQREIEVLKQLEQHLAKGLSARQFELAAADEAVGTDFLRDLNLLTQKPVLYVCNVGEADLTKRQEGSSGAAAGAGAGKGGLEEAEIEAPAQPHNKWVQRVVERAQQEGNKALVVCAQLEAEMLGWSAEDKQSFLRDLGSSSTGLQQLIRESYGLLQLITYFTAGPKECRAWTIRADTKAPQAAGCIHSDFERGFIRAEVYACHDLFRTKSYDILKQKGLLRTEGKDYVVQDGDVMLFRFNV